MVKFHSIDTSPQLTASVNVNHQKYQKGGCFMVPRFSNELLCRLYCTGVSHLRYMVIPKSMWMLSKKYFTQTNWFGWLLLKKGVNLFCV